MSTSGLYIPPWKRKLEASAASTSSSPPADSELVQKRTWEDLRRDINGVVNRLSDKNIKPLTAKLFSLNLIRGQGVLCKSMMRAQAISPNQTPIFAALISVVNTKLPQIGELLLTRLILQFRRAYRRRDRSLTLSTTTFLAHLLNHSIVHEVLALQLLTLLLESPTNDSVSIAVNFTRQAGARLSSLTPRGTHAVMERFRGILHEGDLDKRVIFEIERLMLVVKGGFKDHPPVDGKLDLVDEDEQITFEIQLDEEGLDKQDGMDVFQMDEEYLENEKIWGKIKREVLGEDSDSSDDDSDGEDDTDGSSDSDNEADDESEPNEAPSTSLSVVDPTQKQKIDDMSAQALVNLRRTIYLTIMSSASFEECAHKLAKMTIPEGRECELVNMLIECCSQERTYLRYYGLIAQRFCLLHPRWRVAFDAAFRDNYDTIHRLETNKLRNVAKIFAHLMHTDAQPWTCVEHVRLTQDDTTSSSRIFIKILIQEIAENLGVAKLNERFNNPSMATVFSGLFPRDTPKNTRFAINFFTSIGLGPLTDDLREHLKLQPKLIAERARKEQERLLLLKAEMSTSESESDKLIRTLP
ncbi:hypothetical protein TrRE_jg2720 [Triparma retinervis]|uniref:MI domain-containing protein n=1 Tax=Triparma retinervis TaxID=2557542 RepID=A0A9W7F6Q5_9STRA|nr:hypothetical protein TrRE_jg2720 [Triparma retinervis]